MTAGRFVWPLAVIEAIEGLPPDFLPRVSYSKTPEGYVRVDLQPAPPDGEARSMTIRPCPNNPLKVELLDADAAHLEYVPCVSTAEFRQLIQRAIFECLPEGLEEQFAQLMVDLRNSESVEVLERQLSILDDPAARKIVEEMIALREAVEKSNPTRAEKRQLLHRTNEVLVAFAAYLASKQQSSSGGGC